MAIEVVKLSCNHCGANLKVSDDTRFVTCTYCDTQLEVRRKGGAAFTRVKRSVEKLQRRTKKLARDVARLEHESDIERLERDWERQRRTLLIRTRQGRGIVPRIARANLIIGLAVGLGAVSLLMLFSEQFEQLALFGFLGTLGAAVVGILHRSSAERYERAERAFERARAELEAELDDRRD